jgi:two-component sensor histidine kinase
MRPCVRSDLIANILPLAHVELLGTGRNRIQDFERLLPLGRSMSFSPRDLLAHLWSHRLAYGVCVLGVVAATVVTHVFPPLHTTPNILFLAAVVAAAWFGGRGPAVLAIILSTVAVDFFLVAPVFSLLTSVADVVRLVVFVLVALFVLHLQGRYQQVAIRLNEVNEILEMRVAERTADLASVNQSLRLEVRDRKEAEGSLRTSEAKLRRALEEMSASLNEKEILLRELNHRVKNNLQIITSLLSLQKTRITDRGCQELFADCQHRVRAIALAHQRLCGAPSLANIDLAVYFDQLVRELSRSYCVGPGHITPKVVVEDTVLGVDQLVPTALIVNELVCNAFKYAFPEGRSGEVRVEFQRRDGNVNVSVSDDGIGFSPDDLSSHDSVGLQIVQALVDQLSGKLSWANGHGTCATVAFPLVNS